MRGPATTSASALRPSRPNGGRSSGKSSCALVTARAWHKRRWFAELTTKWIKRSAHRSVRDLVASIRTWITNWNEDPKPYVWHKTADEILQPRLLLPADH